MSDVQQTASVAAFINAFAEGLSAPDPKSISSFYTADGLFLPNGHKTISKNQLENAKGKFFKTRKFRIEFEIKEIVIKDGFAFVQAVGKATTTELTDNLSFTTLSRDLFVLCKEEASWKIYRYMFNDFKKEQSAT